jgi:uncharacterized RDD family membrane protein YckC
MDSAELYQNTASVSPFKGFWIRLVAFILDMIILSIAVILIFLVLVSTASNLFGEDAAIGTVLILFVVFILAMLLYKPLMEASEYQGTFGKYLLGMKIVNQKGERITMTASFIRSIVYLLQTSIPLVQMVSWLALLMIGFTEYKQGLHDIASGTFVVPHQWQGPVPVEDQFGA